MEEEEKRKTSIVEAGGGEGALSSFSNPFKSSIHDTDYSARLNYHQSLDFVLFTIRA